MQKELIRLKPLKHKRSVYYLLDRENNVYKVNDYGDEQEYEEIKPFVGCIAVYMASPITRPFRLLDEKEFTDFLYRGKEPVNGEKLWFIRPTNIHSVDVNGYCSMGCC